MKSAVCTLFEGHYHYGVAALTNSLYFNGFRGTMYVGYRGKLPSWALKGKDIVTKKWNKSTLLSISNDLKICFLLLDTKHSLTNYKPDFMLELLENIENIESLYYFDPDITVNKSWSHFEEWIECGVSLCEDVNSPYLQFHPRRVGWRNYFAKYGLNLAYRNSVYVNGGFIGLNESAKEFLIIWKYVQECMAEAIGGLGNSIFSNHNYKSTIPLRNGFQIFDKTDQDALNATLEIYQGKLSIIGLEAMGFKPGDSLMLHALGSPKPWKTNMIMRTLNGRPPRLVDTGYWKYAWFPVKAHSKHLKIFKKISLYISKMIGRFYKV